MPLPSVRALVLCIAALGGVNAAAQTITVSAAASLQDAMREIGRAFAAVHSGVQADFNFAASGVLLAQIARGAPADVFASADESTMDQAQAGRLIDPATRTDFASNLLVVVVPAKAGLRLARPADLLQADVRRIALGNVASVPAGRYAHAALLRLDLWQPLSPRFVFAESVRQALTYVARGEVDAGFVYRSDALRDAASVRESFVVPMAAPVRYPMARVASSRHAAAADAFIRFASSPAGLEILRRHGFGPP